MTCMYPRPVCTPIYFENESFSRWVRKNASPSFPCFQATPTILSSLTRAQDKRRPVTRKCASCAGMPASCDGMPVGFLWGFFVCLFFRFFLGMLASCDGMPVDFLEGVVLYA